MKTLQDDKRAMPDDRQTSFLYIFFMPVQLSFIKPLYNPAQICIVQIGNDMKTMIFILSVLPPVVEGGPKAGEMNSPTWYIIGALLSVLLLAYLIYALVKPEKF